MEDLHLFKPVAHIDRDSTKSAGYPVARKKTVCFRQFGKNQSNPFSCMKNLGVTELLNRSNNLLIVASLPRIEVE